MSADYSFIALCSSVLNSKTTRKAFLDGKKQAELFTKYNLTPAQKKALKSMNTDAVLAEIKKELDKASKAAASGELTALGW